MWQVFLMYALFGSIFSVGKVALAVSEPYFLTGIRMICAGGIVLIYLQLKKQYSLSISKEHWPALLSIAFFNVFITNAFEFWGLQYMSAGKTCLIYSLSPFAAALIGYFSGSEWMTPKKWVGLTVGIAAFLPMMVVPWLEISNEITQEHELMAECGLVISAITAVIGWNLVKKLTVDKKIPHPLVNGISFLLAGIMSLFASLAFESWDPVPVTDWTPFLWTLLYIVVIHNIICYSIYAASLKHFSVTFMAFAGLSNPLFAGFFGWFFLNETVGSAFWLAFAGIALGLYLYYQEERNLVGNKIIN